MAERTAEVGGRNIQRPAYLNKSVAGLFVLGEGEIKIINEVLKMKIKYFVSIFLVCSLFVFGANSYAGEVRTVSGAIESVSGSSIEVGGRNYDTYGVPLLNSSGHEVSRNQLEPGKIVEIFFEDGKITKVKIHEYIVE